MKYGLRKIGDSPINRFILACSDDSHANQMIKIMISPLRSKYAHYLG